MQVRSSRIIVAVQSLFREHLAHETSFLSTTYQFRKGGTAVTVEAERRKHERILVNWPVVVVTPQRYIGGEAKNISVGGACILCARDPSPSRTLRMAIKIPTNEELLQVTGIVVWSNLHPQPNDLYGYETGIRFTDFIGRSRDYLAKAISGCLKRA